MVSSRMLTDPRSGLLCERFAPTTVARTFNASPRPDRFQPTDFVGPDAPDQGGVAHIVVDEHPAGHRDRMPAARDQPLELGPLGGLRIDVKRLRVIFCGEGDDLVGGHRPMAELADIADAEIFEIKHAPPIGMRFDPSAQPLTGRLKARSNLLSRAAALGWLSALIGADRLKQVRPAPAPRRAPNSGGRNIRPLHRHSPGSPS